MKAWKTRGSRKDLFREEDSDSEGTLLSETSLIPRYGSDWSLSSLNEGTEITRTIQDSQSLESQRTTALFASLKRERDMDDEDDLLQSEHSLLHSEELLLQRMESAVHLKQPPESLPFHPTQITLPESDDDDDEHTSHDPHFERRRKEGTNICVFLLCFCDCSEIHSKCLICSMTLLLSLMVLIYDVNNQHIRDFDEPVIGLVTFAAAYVVSLFECITSDTLSYLLNVISPFQLRAHIDEVKRRPPIFFWDLTCFHIQHTKHWNRTLRRFEVHRRRVDTSWDRGYFHYSGWLDCSNTTDFLDSGQSAVLKVCFRMECDYGDSDTIIEYDRQRRAFLKSNLKDDYYELKSGQIISGMNTERMLCFLPSTHRPWMMHWSVFILSSILGLSFFYRLWFDASTHRCDFVYGSHVYSRREHSSMAGVRALSMADRPPIEETASSSQRSTQGENCLLKRTVSDIPVF